MKGVFLILVVILVLAFVGVEPLSTYKNNILAGIARVLENPDPKVIPQPPPPAVPPEPFMQPPFVVPIPPPTPPPQPLPAPQSKPQTPLETPSPRPQPSPKPQPALIVTDITNNVKAEEMYAGLVDTATITAYLQISASAEPGYYTIELLSRWASFGPREFKYLKTI